MGRKKLEDLTRDPQVLALAHADDHQLVNEDLAAGFLSLSLTVLRGWRSEGRTPPAFVALTGRAIRYPVGELRRFVREILEKAQARLDDHRPAAPPAAVSHSSSAAERMAKITGAKDLTHLGLDQEILRGGRRKQVNHASFAQFMAQAAPEDEWVFALLPDPSRGAYCRPVDLIETLHMSEAEIGEATCAQLTLTEYLERLTAYLAAKPAQELAAERKEQMDTLEPPRRPRSHHSDDRRS